jgi:hypothetical protein
MIVGRMKSGLSSLCLSLSLCVWYMPHTRRKKSRSRLIDVSFVVDSKRTLTTAVREVKEYESVLNET